MEINPAIPKHEKHTIMKEWRTNAHEALLEHRIHCDLITDLLHPSSEVGSQVILREGSNRLLKICHAHDIPVLVFSAGIANIIEEFLAHRQVLLPNCRVLSNRMLFDQHQLHNGYDEPLVHSANKAKICEIAADDLADHRCHFVILGDHLHDAEVGDGIEHAQLHLKVGLLSDRVEERLEDFKATYDVVIIADGPLDFVNDLLDEIISHEPYA